MGKPRYYVTTWDAEEQEFTPQKGLKAGPWCLFGLRRALRKLRGMGYPAARIGAESRTGGCGDPAVLVERRE